MKSIIAYGDMSIVQIGEALYPKVEHNCTVTSRHYLIWWNAGWECAHCDFRPREYDHVTSDNELLVISIPKPSKNSIKRFVSTWLGVDEELLDIEVI